MSKPKLLFTSWIAAFLLLNFIAELRLLPIFAGEDMRKDKSRPKSRQREILQQEANKLTPIASFIPNVVKADDVKTILNEAGIDCRIEGSRAYQILVLAKDVKKAIDVLKRSKIANNITIYSTD